MTITNAVAALIEEMQEEGISDPLSCRLTLGAVIYDLCRLAGEPEPPEVAAILDAAAATPLRPGPGRFIPATTARD